MKTFRFKSVDEAIDFWNFFQHSLGINVCCPKCGHKFPTGFKHPFKFKTSGPKPKTRKKK